MTEKERAIMAQVKGLAFEAIKNLAHRIDVYDEDGFCRVMAIIARVNEINAEFTEGVNKGEEDDENAEEV